jgi:hypothetical protein
LNPFASNPNSDDETEGGALPSVPEEAASPPLAMLSSIQQSQQAAYDEYSAKLRAARTAAAPSTLERLSQALVAAGTPNRWGSTMVGVRQGLENWQQSGADARKMQAQSLTEGAELELKRKLANSDLALKYAVGTAKGNKPPALAKLVTQYNPTTGKMDSFSPFTGAPVPPGMVVLMSGQVVPFSSVADAGAVDPAYVGGGAGPGPQMQGPTPQMQGPTPQMQGPTPQMQGAAPGAEWQKYQGQTVSGDMIGLNPNAMYLVETTGPKVIPGTRIVSGDDAMRASGGTYNRGQVDETGKFTPFSDKDRLGTPDEIRASLTGINAALAETTANYNQIQALSANFNGLTTGMLGKGLSLVPGTPQYDVAAQLKRSVSAIALGKLKELKQQSATGASGLGSVTERELALLEASIAPLDQAQSPEAIRAAAQTVMKHYKAVLASLQNDGQQMARKLQQARGYQGGSPASAAPAGGKVLRYDPKSGTFK